jgi:putative copper export protein
LLSIDADVIRIFIHVLAATVWVGGQLVLGALVPVLKKLDPGAPAAAARKFAQVAWPAFIVLVLSGVWNLLTIESPSTEYSVTLGVKLMLVTISGLGAALHSVAKSRAILIVGGIAGLAGALAALLLGVTLALGS